MPVRADWQDLPAPIRYCPLPPSAIRAKNHPAPANLPLQKRNPRQRPGAAISRQPPCCDQQNLTKLIDSIRCQPYPQGLNHSPFPVCTPACPAIEARADVNSGMPPPRATPNCKPGVKPIPKHPHHRSLARQEDTMHTRTYPSDCSCSARTHQKPSPLADITGLESLLTEKKYKAFGIEYKHLKPPNGGDLYLTEFGAAVLRCLLPQNWYDDEYFFHHGTRLLGTSAVYKVTTKPVFGGSIDIVVKFCRIGEDVNPLLTSRSKFISDDDFASARWNGPFEEFGKLMDLRRGVYGPKKRFLTQRPLGIFVPAKLCEDWQLGRSADSFRISRAIMDKDNTLTEDHDPVELDINRQYILIYSWVKGLGLDDLLKQGLLDREICDALTEKAYFEDMIPNGFKVLDTKPAHIILRVDKMGNLVTRNGQYPYALIDYELLRRTPEHERSFGLSRRRRYWQHVYERFDKTHLETMPSELKSLAVNDIPYIFGPTPNGGKLWVVGNNHKLFDFFLPEKWRSRDRIRLSSKNEVYHSVTPDNIHLVYKRSRVGILPESNPLDRSPSPVVELGYNSPFEEVFIAEYLRNNGICTTHPPAISRTGQRSTMARFNHDPRRYDATRHLLTPEDPPEQILSDHHDYYVLWGCWRGIDPEKGYFPASKHWGLTTISQALNDKLINEDQANKIMKCTQARLETRGLADLFIGKYDFLLSFNNDTQTLQLDSCSEYKITIAMDACQAYQHDIIDDDQYRGILLETASDLSNVGYEMLNLGGDHLLISATPEGTLIRDESGRIQRSICNFDLIRKI